MNKKVLITATILLFIGIIGVIPSIFYTIPFVGEVVKNVDAYVKQQDKLTLVETKAEAVDTVIVKGKRANIEFVKSDSNQLEVYATKNDHQYVKVETNYDAASKTFTVQELESEDDTSFTFTDFRNDFQKFVNNVSMHRQLTIRIAIPNTIPNVSIQSTSGNVAINDRSVVNQSVTINSSGNISLSGAEDGTTLENLVIMSNSHLNFNITELVNIKNVKITSNSLQISDNDYGSYVFNYDKNNYAIENLNILTNQLQLNAEGMIAKNIEVNKRSGYFGSFEIEMPFSRMNTMFNLKSKNPIEFDNFGNDFNSQPISNYSGNAFYNSGLENTLTIDSGSSQLIIRNNN